MDISKTIPNISPRPRKAIHSDIGSFKNVLEKKGKEMRVTAADLLEKKPTDLLNHAINEMINNHEMATKSIKTSMARTNYSPEKLLAIQYKTGILFLREQMFSKTAELSANTLKNFTQMQV